MTFSILALDPEAGQIGVGVQSHYFGVGSLVPWAKPGVGVVATQSVVRAAYGPELLARLAAGRVPAEALAETVALDAGQAVRQVAVMAVDGRGATHTGAGCIQAAGHAEAPLVRAQANLVAGPRVWHAMVEAFDGTSGTLVERMLAAMDAAQEAGGDLRGQQAAALHVVSTTDTGDLAADTVLDIRVDDDVDPLGELRRLARSASALSGLVRMLEEPGLLIGPPNARADVVTRALDELAAASDVLGETNVEPMVWSGLLLARNGRTEEATALLGRAAASLPTVPDLLRSLAAAGMWQSDPEELVRLARPLGVTPG